MKITKTLIAVILALLFEPGIKAAHTQEAAPQTTLSDLVATARQTLAFKAMTVPQLLIRLQVPAVPWLERKQIVEELRGRPAREVLPLLYQVLTAHGPFQGYGGWGSDPYIYGGRLASWDEQVRIVLDKLWSYQTGVEGFEDLDHDYYALAEQPNSDEKNRMLGEMEKKRAEAYRQRHQEIGHVLLNILRADKIKYQTGRIMDGFSFGYSWIREAQPDVIAVSGDTKTDAATRWRALNTLMQGSESDDYPAISKALHQLPLAEQLACLNQLSHPMGLARQPLLDNTDAPDFYILQFGFDLLKQAVATQGAQSENAVKIARALAEYARVNFALYVPADLKSQPSEAEIQQHNKDIAAYDKTRVQSALDWWQQNAAKYKAQSETETIVFVPN